MLARAHAHSMQVDLTVERVVNWTNCHVGHLYSRHLVENTLGGALAIQLALLGIGVDVLIDKLADCLLQPPVTLSNACPVDGLFSQTDHG